MSDPFAFLANNPRAACRCLPQRLTTSVTVTEIILLGGAIRALTYHSGEKFKGGRPELVANAG